MKIRVLFLAADPKDLDELALATEVEAIRENIIQSDFADQIEIVPRWSPQPDDLIELLNRDDDWDIVHYSGHGSDAYELMFVDEDGNSKPVSAQALERLFAIMGKKARVAVFNACFAVGEAEAVTRHIDCAIGMATEIGDEAAILFASSFYRAIGFGRSIQQAFEQGLLSIDLEGIPETETPQIRSRSGFDPADFYLLSDSTPYQVPDELLKLAPPPPDVGEGQKWHAFLSYRSVNRFWALNLYDVLHQQGYSSFFDQFTLQAGKPLNAVLEEGLRKSRTGVLIWSTANADSEWCVREYETMLKRRKKDPAFTFVTLTLDGPIPQGVEKDYWLDFSDSRDGPNGGNVLRLLFALAGRDFTPDAVRFENDLVQQTHAAEAQIAAAIENGNRKELKKLFETGGLAWKTSTVLPTKVAEALTKLGEYDDAVSIAEQVVEQFPRSVRPRQIKALALARRAADTNNVEDLEKAQQILGVLRADGNQDPETLGIYARTWMDRYEASGRKIDLRKSRQLYADAFEHAPDNTYTGINAAAKSVFLGEIEPGRSYAQRVADRFDVAPPADYWERATIAEAHLILGDYSAAANEYADAVIEASEERGSLESTWKQAQLLHKALDVPESEWTSIAAAFDGIFD